jgi:hypothetical protein
MGGIDNHDSPQLPTAALMESSSTVGQGLTANALAVTDQQRQLVEEIANAFRQAAVPQPIEVREVAVVGAKPAFDGPIPLPRKRPSPRPPTDLSTSAVGWGSDDLR